MSILWRKSDGKIIISQCAIKVAFCFLRIASSQISIGIFGSKLDGVIIICQGAVHLSTGFLLASPVEEVHSSFLSPKHGRKGKLNQRNHQQEMISWSHKLFDGLHRALAAAVGARAVQVNQDVPRLGAFAGADDAATFQFVHDARGAGVAEA
jgi:hypothetical protein